MESLIKAWEGETVIVQYDTPTGVWIFISIYSTQLGPAAGGTRMKAYPDIRQALLDSMRLAKGMAYKYAVPGMPWGGGKAVIALPHGFADDSRPGLLHRYGKLIHQLGGLFSTGPDVGTCSEDIDMIAETGSPHVFACTPRAGGSGSSGPYTALGVFTGIQTACEHLFGDDSLSGRTVLVQGTGGVGGPLIERLLEAGAVVAFSEIDEAAIRRYGDELGLTFVRSEDVFETPCDIFAPCALGGLFNEASIPRLKCRVVAGGANNQLLIPEDAERLRTRGILYAPDYVINVGGAMAVLGMETLGWNHDRAEREVVGSVRKTLHQVFELAEGEAISTEAAASRIAEERLKTDR
jgi:leucine dehydrogenase